MTGNARGGNVTLLYEGAQVGTGTLDRDSRVVDLHGWVGLLDAVEVDGLRYAIPAKVISAGDSLMLPPPDVRWTL